LIQIYNNIEENIMNQIFLSMNKHTTAFILSSLFSTLGLAQNDTLIAQAADLMPYFRGCSTWPNGSPEKRDCSNQAMVHFISKTLEMPKDAEATGVVYAYFFIDENGKVENPKILRGLENSQNEAALNVLNNMPTWEPALLDNKPVKVKMTLPIRFKQKDESEYSNGFQLLWGNIKGQTVEKTDLLKTLTTPISVRDEKGNLLEVSELMFEREREGKYADAQSNGVITDNMQRLVKKLKNGDNFTVTVTVQKKGQFYYIDKNFKVEN
jgi:Gram-negative bacterial TonB protein C-terminal